jgi:hypothetical protein
MLDENLQFLWITNNHHCTVSGALKEVKKFVKAFKKHQGTGAVKNNSLRLFTIHITEDFDRFATSIDNSNFHISVDDENVKIVATLKKLFFQLGYQINFNSGAIESIYLKPASMLFYHLFCLRIVLPACSYALLNFGWLRLKASSILTDKNVILLPGFSGDGKTTRALQELKVGSQILNDTFTFISTAGEISASYNSLQIFRRNFDTVKFMLPFYDKVVYVIKSLLSVCSFGLVNISHEIKYPKSHFTGEGDVLMEIFPKYENIWKKFRLVCASDYNENKEFYNLLNIHPFGDRNSLLDIHVAKYKDTLEEIFKLKKVSIL